MRPKGSIRTPGSGRKKGTPNKDNAAIKDMIRHALDGAGGVEYLIRQAEENPGPFMGLIGKIIPAEVSAKVEGRIDLASIIAAAAQPPPDQPPT
jgi:hypothetical protein